MSLNDVATINVSTTSAGVTRAGFGIPLILSHTANWVERYRVYTSIAAVGVDFAVNTPEYMAANKIFSAAIPVPQIMIGRAASAPTQTFSIGVPTGAALINNVYKVRVAVPTGVQWVSQDAQFLSPNGATPWSPSQTWLKGALITNVTGLYSCLGVSAGASGYYSNSGIGAASGPTGRTALPVAEGQLWWLYVGTGNTGAITNDAVMNGLKAAIENLTSPPVVGTGLAQLSSSLQGGQFSHTLQLIANSAGAFFGLRVYNRAALSIAQTHADPGVATDLAAIKLASNAWYGLVTLYNSASLVGAAAAWVESNTKLYPAASLDSGIATVADSTPATDIAHVDKGLSYARSWIFHHPSNDEFADAAEMGKFFPVSPGGETWRMKTLVGVTAETYTDTELSNMNDKFVHFYYVLGGVSVVGGKAESSANEFVDTVRFIDWYTANLQADLADLLIQNDKIPYTDPGIDQIEAKVTKRNSAGIAAGGIAASPKPSVTSPNAADATSANKAARELAGVTTVWTLAGAIHHITVTVTANQ